MPLERLIQIHPFTMDEKDRLLQTAKVSATVQAS